MKSFTRFLLVGIPLIVVAAAAVPFVASAQTNTKNEPPSIWPTGYWGVSPDLLTCNGNYPISTGTSNNNPDGQPNCTSLTDLEWTFVNIIYFMMTIGLFVIAPILFIIGGIMMMLSAGNAEKIGKARSTMIAAAVGVVIVLVAYVVVSTVVTTLNIGCVGGFSTANCATGQ